MISGKCEHRVVVAHRAENGYDFFARCRDCGLTGKTKQTPYEAYGAFPYAKGKRPKMQKEDDAALALFNWGSDGTQHV